MSQQYFTSHHFLRNEKAYENFAKLKLIKRAQIESFYEELASVYVKNGTE